LTLLSVYPIIPDFSERRANHTSFLVEGVRYTNGHDIDLAQYTKDYIDISNIHEDYALLSSFDLSDEKLIKESFVTYSEFETICVDIVPKSGRIFFYKSDYPEYLFFTSGKRKERVFHRYNIETGDDLVVPAGGKPLYMNDHMIVVGLVGYDNSGKELWRFKRNEPSRSINYGAPILSFKDLIIFANEGADGKPNSIIALNAESGTINWEYPLPFEIRRMNLDHGRICLATGNQMLALDSQSGKALADFKADIEDSQHTLLWFDGSYYYVIDAQGNRLQAYSSEALKQVNEWTLPIEFKPQLRKPPRTLDGVNCMEMLNASLIDTSVYGGLLSWTSDDVRSGNPIEFDRPYPEVDVEIFKEDKKEAYRVRVHVQNIHDLLRYGEIEIKRIAANNGKQRWGLDIRNKKFNGHVELLVDPAIGEENAQYLDALMRRCEYFARLHDVTSGSGRQPIKPTWCFESE
jgi:hypothetical protein